MVGKVCQNMLDLGLWSWLPLSLSERQLPLSTVRFRTTSDRTVTRDQLLLSLCSWQDFARVCFCFGGEDAKGLVTPQQGVKSRLLTNHLAASPLYKTEALERKIPPATQARYSWVQTITSLQINLSAPCLQDVNWPYTCSLRVESSLGVFIQLNTLD